MTDALVWAVKTSFVEYVEALGEVEVIAPAIREGAGPFRFPRGKSGDGFTGGVAFRAHHGALDVLLSDLRIEDAALTVDVTDHGRAQGRIVLAKVDGAGRVVLEATGAVIFDFTYPLGTELAPLVNWR